MRAGKIQHFHRITSPKIIEVAAGLVFRHGKLLITLRRSTDHLGGLWEFPGGKREPKETFQQCLKRELIEELGMEVDVHQLVQSVTHAYPEKTVMLNFYRCTWILNEPRPIGCEALAWVNRDELSEYKFPAADARLLKELHGTDHYWQED